MSNQGKKYTKEDLMELGRMNVEENESIRELAEKYGVSKSTVSKAKDIYLSYHEGKKNGKNKKEREMSSKINRLEGKIARSSPSSKGDNENGSSKVDPQNYIRDHEGDSVGQEVEKEDGSNGGWVAVGLGALLGVIGIIFKDWWR